MNFLIVLSLAIAAASAVHPYGHLYGQHIPLIDHTGVPVDTPDVQAAKALHFSAHAAANHGVYGIGHHGYAPLAYAGLHHHYPIIDGAGRPIDTPEVQHAKAAHFAAYNEAAARNGVGHYRKRRGLAAYTYPFAQHIPVIDHTGVPVDTPEVQHAKAEHFAAHAKIGSSHALAPLVAGHALPYAAGHALPYAAGHALPYAAAHAHHYPIHIPVITPHGVPVDTPEVQHEKAKHFAAHAEVSARNSVLGHHGLAYHHY